jgi:hypothetical protein
MGWPVTPTKPRGWCWPPPTGLWGWSTPPLRPQGAKPINLASIYDFYQHQKKGEFFFLEGEEDGGKKIGTQKSKT